ncbi:neuferricin [Copidosoma floridanum]|uniref:neuferricin n=1 Tax=Copidosoma floridanum TaxID=29053 RepID=UPI0006C9C4DC|nr:neuferricin [Copidosoma floridanum]
MLPKSIWLLFLGSAVYMLYSSDYYFYVKSYVKHYYAEALRLLYDANSSNEIVLENGEILFTSSALEKYTDLDSGGLYLSILGQVFDVTKGEKHYGPGQSYHAFTGRDGSAAFITGDFTESGLTDDVSSLTNKQIQSIMTWLEFYRKTYVYKGKLVGRYYDKNGKPTNERSILEERIQIAKKNDLNEDQEKSKFPPCNVEWNPDSGTRVWCTKNSGGIARNWIGVPRLFYTEPGSKKHRCACVNTNSKDFQENKNMFKTYSGCADNETSCIFKVTT